MCGALKLYKKDMNNSGLRIMIIIIVLGLVVTPLLSLL